MIPNQTHIIFVDDEPLVCKAVSQTLGRHGYQVQCYFAAETCMKELGKNNCDLLITDVNMPGMDGIEFLREIKKKQPSLPVLIVTGYGDIPMAIRAIKTGAEDFIEKPLNRDTLLPTIQFILNKYKKENSLEGYFLTPVEKKVLRLLMSGKTNKEIAQQFHRSIRTIECHRASVMHKLGAKNLVDLVKRSMKMRLGNAKIDL
jgi:two-component system, LuxR family, response regulator FixJ